MNFDLAEIGKTIAKVGAPLLGSVVAGPAGGVIGQLIASQLGASTNTDDLVKKIIADPVKVLEIESNTKVQLQQMALEQTKSELARQTQQQQLDFDNTKNAREMNAKSESYMAQIVSFIVMIGFFGCIVLVARFHQQPEDEQVIYMMFGSVSMAFGAVINYWIGSSNGSRMKDVFNRKS